MKYTLTVMLTAPLVFVMACQDGDNNGGKSAAEKELEVQRIRKEQIDSAKALVHTTVKVLHMYQMDSAHYPTKEEGGLYALIKEPKTDGQPRRHRWNGPYIDCKTFKDPWGNELKYELAEGPAGRTQPRVWSCGLDGKDDGGEGDDIRSWDE